MVKGQEKGILSHCKKENEGSKKNVGACLLSKSVRSMYILDQYKGQEQDLYYYIVACLAWKTLDLYNMVWEQQARDMG